MSASSFLRASACALLTRATRASMAAFHPSGDLVFALLRRRRDDMARRFAKRSLGGTLRGHVGLCAHWVTPLIRKWSLVGH